MKSKLFYSEKKKTKKIWKHPAFAVVMLVLAVICFAACALLPEYSYGQKAGRIRFENPESFGSSGSGRRVIVDDRSVIYCMDADENLIYAVDIEQFSYENAEIIDVAFDSEDRLYCHIAVYNEGAYLTDSEVVVELDAAGHMVREILHYDYQKTENPPIHQVRLFGLHVYGEKLRYLYCQEDGTLVREVDPDTPQQSREVFLPNEGFGEILQCHAAPAGGFLVLKNNGEIAEISYDGAYRILYKAAYDARKEEGMFLYDVCMAEDGFYMLEGWNEPVLYEWQEGDWKALLSVKESIQMSEDTDLYAFGLGEYAHKPALHINESLYVLEGGEVLIPYGADISLPHGVTACMWLKQMLPYIAVVFLLFGIVCGLGCLMRWRLTILSKQLLSTIPVVFLMLAVVTVSMLISMIRLNSEDILRETIAINEIAAAQFAGEELQDITGYESVDNGQIKDLSSRLRTFMNGNQSGWSRKYSAAIYIRTVGETFVRVAGSDGSAQFMVSSFSTEEPINRYYYEDSHTFAAEVSYGETQKNLHLILMTPISMEDGSYDAVMMLTASQDRLVQEIYSAGERALLYIVLWVVLLILVISLMSAYNVRSLRKAKEVVAKIAGGDFSVRVDTYSKDETGEICAGVNDMAARLEEYFAEKSRNEQFYYKFVPEKFRELLHKENFTDLALGDAQSADLSILFCDIRAFSLNSEMMTAKESFDFVNRIYGKAGPIIRKHNGFVDKYIGDAVMALFESADDAVAAGIELYRAIVLSPDAEKEFGIPSVKVGIGIHSGMARIGIVGEEQRMSGTVIANTVNLSSRMEALTKQYGAGMIISKDTLDRMKNPDALSTRYLGMVQVAGVNEVAGLYEVLDCLEDGQRQKREQTKAAFREAVRMFHSGEVQKSLDMFRELTAQDAEDKATQLYVDHIEDKIQRGDTEHNVFRFKRKG